MVNRKKRETHYCVSLFTVHSSLLTVHCGRLPALHPKIDGAVDFQLICILLMINYLRES